jgi:hypothetical protein
MRQGKRMVRRAALAATLAAVGCSESTTDLPRPVAISQQPIPEITPVPAPDPICLGRMSAGTSRSEPKKLHHVDPKLPTLRTRGPFGSTMWSGVAEIAPDGSVAVVRTTPPPSGRPMAPEWEEAIRAAIRQWRYEPTCVDGHPVRTEIHIAVSVHI